MGKRDEARAHTIDRILTAARGEIARVGGVGLSMRSVAREAGMVSSAIYRYFPSREDLLTAMILESYRGLAGVLRHAETSHESADSDAERWSGLAGALRDWGLRAPHEFQLIYGTPIPGYVAPAETIPAAGEVAAPFLGCPGTRRVPGFEPSTGTSGLHALADDVGITPSAAAAVVAAISELVGFVGLELAGHFVGLADPADELYAAVAQRQVRDLGLDQPRGRSALP
ncbi:MAG: TetR/AcrR family transcriptional regulator [Dietzia sp.]